MKTTAPLHTAIRCTNPNWRLATLASLSALALLPLPTFAQITDQQHEGTLEEIVVTAQRREEFARDVPITITAVNSEQLQKANISSLMALPKVTPGLRFDQEGSYTQPTIRAIGTSVVQTGAGSSVGIYVDGYYLPTTLSADLKFLNVESIQILKGPQGTLFGRNTPGGAILVNTAEPSLEDRVVLEGSYGRYNAQTYQAYGTTGVTDNVAVSLEGMFSKGDGFVDNIYNGSLSSGGGFAPDATSNDPGAYENWALRMGVKANLSETSSLLFRYAHSETDDPTAIVTGVLQDDTTGDIYSSGAPVPGALFGIDRGDVANNAATLFTVEADTFQLTGNFDLGFAELVSYSQYREEEIEQQVDSDASSAAVFALSLPETDRILSQEFLLNSTLDGPLQYTTGLFFFQHEVDADVLIPYVNGFVFPYSATGVDIRTYAAFADATYELTDRLFLTGGLRLSRDEVKSPYYQTTAGVPGVFTYQPEFSDDKMTPRVVLRYQPSDDSSVYVSFTKGYKSAIYDPRATSGDDYLKPEDVTAWEVGYKFAQPSLSGSIAPFYYQYENLQNAYYRVGETILSNAAESTIKGIEGELRFQTDLGLELAAAASYVDATFDDYVNAGYFDPRYNASGDFSGFTTTSIDASGFQMHRSPKTSGNLSASYNLSLAQGELALSTNLFFTSKFYFDPAHQFEQDAYQLVAARAAWTAPSGRYTVALFGDNLTDEEYYTQINQTPFGAGVIWGTPLTYGVSLRVEM